MARHNTANGGQSGMRHLLLFLHHRRGIGHNIGGCLIDFVDEGGELLTCHGAIGFKPLIFQIGLKACILQTGIKGAAQMRAHICGKGGLCNKRAAAKGAKANASACRSASLFA